MSAVQFLLACGGALIAFVVYYVACSIYYATFGSRYSRQLARHVTLAEAAMHQAAIDVIALALPYADHPDYLPEWKP